MGGTQCNPPFYLSIDFQKNNLTASSVGDIRVSMISSLLPFDRLRAKPCEINFLKIYTLIVCKKGISLSVPRSGAWCVNLVNDHSFISIFCIFLSQRRAAGDSQRCATIHRASSVTSAIKKADSYFLNFLLTPTSAAKPRPSRSMVPGSGTSLPPGSSGGVSVLEKVPAWRNTPESRNWSPASAMASLM